MLYDTHKRYGQVAGIVMLPVAVGAGVMEVGSVELSESFGGGSFVNILTMLAYVFIALKGSVFGAGFPDLDSPGSKPAQNYKLLAKLFRLFGVKHRGKFSHDILTQSVLWGIVYGTVIFVGDVYVVGEVEMFILSVVKVYVFFAYVGVLSHLIADAMTVEGVWFAGKIKVRFMPVFIRKVGVGSWKPFKSWFTTSSVWNDINYKVMTFMVPVSAVVVTVMFLG